MLSPRYEHFESEIVKNYINRPNRTDSFPRIVHPPTCLSVGEKKRHLAHTKL